MAFGLASRVPRAYRPRQPDVAGTEWVLEVARTIAELIDLRSFSNIWFWIALAVAWSSASHWVLGVPWDMVVRARRRGGQAEADLDELVRINVGRLLSIGRRAGLVLVAFGFFLYALLAVLGFGYGVEFCQALFLLLFPAGIVFLASLSTAKLIEAGQLTGAALQARLLRHRRIVQGFGFLSILVTALWGMFKNFQAAVLGG